MIIEYLFYIAVGVQILYYGILLMKIIFFRQSTKIDNNHHLPVSVVICARNEAENLQKNLPKILEQDYTEFEVIVVNDGSEDNSAIILKELQLRYSSLKIIDIAPGEKKTAGKKGALQKGIESASHGYLLMTDADCFPTGNQWIKKMVDKFTPDTQLILGAAPYENQGIFLHDIVDYETITTLIQYTGFAVWGMPYMGVGRNIAYTRELYNKVGGFANHLHIASGDDDLFVQEAVKYTKAGICLDSDTYMYSIPPGTFSQWWRQKVRHYTTGASYNWGHQLLLGAFIMTKIFIYGIIVTNLTNITYLQFHVCYLLILYFVLYVFCQKFMLKMKCYKIIALDAIYVGTILAQGLQSKLFRKSSWK